MCLRITKDGVKHSILMETLDAMNAYRKNHAVAPLLYERELELSAENAVIIAVRLDKICFRNTEPIQCGECIGRLQNGENNVTGAQLVATWYVDGNEYDYSLEKSNFDTSAFTQMIWAATQYVGLAVKVNENKDVFFVAHFFPKGNTSGNFKLNVFPRNNHTRLYENHHEMNRIAVQRINYYRLKHHSAPLAIALDLISSAQKRARLLVAGSELPSSSPYKYLWESSAISYQSENSFQFEPIIDNWYRLGNTYDFSNGISSTDTDYFTQMVWRETQFVGFAKAFNRGRNAFVAHFSPIGNICEEYFNNVKRPNGYMVSRTSKSLNVQ